MKNACKKYNWGFTFHLQQLIFLELVRELSRDLFLRIEERKERESL